MRLLAGTSGYGYREWKGSFYPEKLPTTEYLRFYAERFPAVEINSSFYNLPTEAQLAQWLNEAPADFIFVLKAWQQITHRKRLKEIEEPLVAFLKAARVLDTRLGPIFFQLPPNFKKDLPRLESLLSLVPDDVRLAFEFRHTSWFEDDVHEALRARGAALCIAHGEAVDTPMTATAGWGYVRLRGVDYDDDALTDWVGRVLDQPWSEAFVFFKHEETGSGPRLARRFRELFDDQASRGLASASASSA